MDSGIILNQMTDTEYTSLKAQQQNMIFRRDHSTVFHTFKRPQNTIYCTIMFVFHTQSSCLWLFGRFHMGIMRHRITVEFLPIECSLTQGHSYKVSSRLPRQMSQLVEFDFKNAWICSGRGAVSPCKYSRFFPPRLGGTKICNFHMKLSIIEITVPANL